MYSDIKFINNVKIIFSYILYPLRENIRIECSYKPIFLVALLPLHLICIFESTFGISPFPNLLYMIVWCEAYLRYAQVKTYLQYAQVKRKPLRTIADPGCIHIIIVAIRTSFISNSIRFYTAISLPACASIYILLGSLCLYETFVCIM